MLFCINLIHGGLVAAIISFILWSLPGALAAFELAQGLSNVNNKLPDAVYALLSGLSAATVGTIVLAAFQLSQQTVTDRFSRTLVFLGATADILYNALWYFPILMAAAGLAAVIWDYKVAQRLWRAIRQGQRRNERTVEPSDPTNARETHEDSRSSIPLHYTWKIGLAVTAAFLVSFIVIMVLRSKLATVPSNHGFALFTNMYLAGTIIFGGGPVVIPLLREYVVAEGWVTPRDILLGLSITQAFPGPNFNFAVFLGALTVKGTSIPLIAGALIAFMGIFTPGHVLVIGTMAFWKSLRRHLCVRSALRGTNSAAVGLVYTAVYRLWLIGYIDGERQYGSSLDREPWWVVVVATAFFTGMWFSLQPVWAIILGGVMGLSFFPQSIQTASTLTPPSSSGSSLWRSASMPFNARPLRHLTTRPQSQDHVWISDQLLRDSLDRFTQRSSSSSRSHVRHASNVPGPMEAHRRLAKRRMTHIAVNASSNSALLQQQQPPPPLGVFDLSWLKAAFEPPLQVEPRWEPPSHVRPGHNTSGDVEKLFPMPSWLLDLESEHPSNPEPSVDFQEALKLSDGRLATIRVLWHSRRMDEQDLLSNSNRVLRHMLESQQPATELLAFFRDEQLNLDPYTNLTLLLSHFAEVEATWSVSRAITLITSRLLLDQQLQSDQLLQLASGLRDVLSINQLEGSTLARAFAHFDRSLAHQADKDKIEFLRVLFQAHLSSIAHETHDHKAASMLCDVFAASVGSLPTYSRTRIATDCLSAAVSCQVPSANVKHILRALSEQHIESVVILAVTKTFLVAPKLDSAQLTRWLDILRSVHGTASTRDLMYGPLSGHVAPWQIADHLKKLSSRDMIDIVLQYWLIPSQQDVDNSPELKVEPDFVMDNGVTIRREYEEPTLLTDLVGIEFRALPNEILRKMAAEDVDLKMAPFAAFVRTLKTYRLQSTNTIKIILDFFHHTSRPREFTWFAQFAGKVLGLRLPRSSLKSFVNTYAESHPSKALAVFLLEKRLVLSDCPDLAVSLISAPSIHPMWPMKLLSTSTSRKARRARQLTAAHVDMVHAMAVAYSQTNRLPHAFAFRSIYKCWQHLKCNNVSPRASMSEALVVTGILKPFKLYARVPSGKMRWICDRVADVQGQAAADDLFKSVNLRLTSHLRSVSRGTAVAHRPRDPRVARMKLASRLGTHSVARLRAATQRMEATRT